MVRLALPLHLHSMVLRRRLMGMLCAALLVLAIGSAIGGALHVRAARNPVRITSDGAPSVERVDPRPVPAPGPRPCVDSFCMTGAVE